MDKGEAPAPKSHKSHDTTQQDEIYVPRLAGISTCLKTSFTPVSLTTKVSAQQVRKDGAQIVCGNGSTTDYFTSLIWSLDGTTVLLPTASHRLDTYVLPPDLLDPLPSQLYHDLEPYTTHGLPEPTHATIIHPCYTLSSPQTCLYLTSPCNLPIRLLSPFAKGILATYPLVKSTTEAWIAPYSLLFNPRDLNTFFAGADGLVAAFDLQRNGEGPISKISTSKRRQRRAGPAARLDPTGNMRGIVSAMAMNAEGVLAAGTFTGKLGLYNANSAAPLVTECNLPGDARTGITSLHFNPSPFRSNYLLAVSRVCCSMHLFDIRNPSAPLSVLCGRQAKTQQRLSVDFTENGEVWAGGTDGVVSVWEGVGLQDGELQAAWGWEAHGDVIGGVGVHPLGARVVASCSGSRRYDPPRSYQGARPDCEDIEESEMSDTDSVSSQSVSASSASSQKSPASIPDSSLKLWAL
ncbi:MAG: hypothetical protein Q9163_002169 [Psora crenata]